MLNGIPSVRGTLTENKSLDKLTWLRVGGPADLLFQPADVDDLADFLAALDPEIPVFPIGVGSNLIVRDGGIRGVVIRLGRGFNGVEFDGNRITTGAAMLDAMLARKAAALGLDLTFLRTIPGGVGGAVRMNAGCYGHYVADVFVSAKAVTRAGEKISLTADDLQFGYRQTKLPADTIITEVVFKAPSGDAQVLERRMTEQLAKRNATQPTKERSAGSTFRNPAGFSSTGQDDDSHELKAWKVIDDAGLRGFTIGGAQMSEMHPNFMINKGGATAAELEKLGEEVIKRVFKSTGLTLEWEIRRIGEPDV